MVMWLVIGAAAVWPLPNHGLVCTVDENGAVTGLEGCGTSNNCPTVPDVLNTFLTDAERDAEELLKTQTVNWCGHADGGAYSSSDQVFVRLSSKGCFNNGVCSTPTATDYTWEQCIDEFLCWMLLDPCRTEDQKTYARSEIMATKAECWKADGLDSSRLQAQTCEEKLGFRGLTRATIEAADSTVLNPSNANTSDLMAAYDDCLCMYSAVPAGKYVQDHLLSSGWMCNDLGASADSTLSKPCHAYQCGGTMTGLHTQFMAVGKTWDLAATDVTPSPTPSPTPAAAPTPTPSPTYADISGGSGWSGSEAACGWPCGNGGCPTPSEEAAAWAATTKAKCVDVFGADKDSALLASDLSTPNTLTVGGIAGKTCRNVLSGERTFDLVAEGKDWCELAAEDGTGGDDAKTWMNWCWFSSACDRMLNFDCGANDEAALYHYMRHFNGMCSKDSATECHEAMADFPGAYYAYPFCSCMQSTTLQGLGQPAASLHPSANCGNVLKTFRGGIDFDNAISARGSFAPDLSLAPQAAGTCMATGKPPGTTSSGQICSAYASSSCCTADMLDRMKAGESFDNMGRDALGDTTWRDYDDFTKMLASNDFSLSSSCKYYLEDRLGCARCSPDSDANLKLESDGVSFTLCTEFQEDFEDNCQEFFQNRKAFTQTKVLDKIGAAFKSTWDMENIEQIKAMWNDVQTGPRVSQYKVLYSDGGSCFYVNHAGMPTIYKILIGAGCVLFLGIATVLACCCCRGKDKKGKPHFPGGWRDMMSAPKPNPNMPMAGGHAGQYGAQSGMAHASMPPFGGAATGPPMGGGFQPGPALHGSAPPAAGAYDGGKYGRV